MSDHRYRAAPRAAEQQLRALVHRGMQLPFQPQGETQPTPLRHSAVLLLFGETPGPGDLSILLTRRTTRMRHHAGQIAFPGGGVEPGDTDAAATALRETAEETGVDPRSVTVLGELPAVHIPVSNNLVTPVLGWWHTPGPLASDGRETSAAFCVPLPELLTPAARGTALLTRGSQRFRSPGFLLAPRFGGQLIWGFTGAVLAALWDELGWGEGWDPETIFTVPA